MRVLILHDALGEDIRPDEEDTLVQVRSVEAALIRSGHRASTLAFDTDLQKVMDGIRAAAPEVVFNLVESVARAGRLIHFAPALLETLGVPFTGASAAAMFLSSSKLLSKQILRAARLPTPRWYTAAELAEDPDVAGERWLLKSVWEHGSLGLEADAVVETRSGTALGEILSERLAELGGEGFAEAYVHGREFNVAVLATGGPAECLPVPEIHFEGGEPGEPRIVGYRAKWSPDSPEWAGTPRSFTCAPGDQDLYARLRELAIATVQAFDLEGVARVDFRVDERGEPFIIDVNANPCLSPDAGLAAALEAAGIRYDAAILRLVHAALLRPSHHWA